MAMFTVEGYRLDFRLGDSHETPFATGIPFVYAVTIAHESQPRLKVTLPYGTGYTVSSLPDAAQAFANMCSGALMGSLGPLDFCRAMKLDPTDSSTEGKFLACREVTEKIYGILSDRDKPAELMRRIRSNSSLHFPR